MAEKHKSKHKTPKDFAKSLKAETRKDMKDYTAEDAPNMVPGGVKGVVPGVARIYATDVFQNFQNILVLYIYSYVFQPCYYPFYI